MAGVRREMNAPSGSCDSTLILRNLLADPANGEAFQRFARKYEPRIRARCIRRGLQDCDADDLTAELLVEFFEGDSLRRFLFAGKEKFNRWLGVVVKRRVLDFYRRRGRKPDAWSVGNEDAQRAMDRVAGEWVAELADTCSDDLELAAKALDHVEAATDPKHMKAFRMRVFKDRRAADVAEELDMTDVGVWQAQSRINRMLREEFARLKAEQDQ